MRVVLFLASLVAACLTGCIRDSGETATILEPQPIDGAPKKASAAVTPDSGGLSGVYEGDAAVITVSKVNEAWEINCVAKNEESYHSYLSTTPFNGERDIYGLTYNCTTGKKKTKNIYRVSFKKKKKNLQCTDYDKPIIAEYDSRWALDLGGSQLMFNNPPYLDMCMAMMRTDDCGMFAGPYPKK